MAEVVTDRLTLRRTQPHDFDAVLDIFGRPEVARMVASWPIPADHDLIRERCMPFPPEDGIVGVVLADETVVGTMGIARKPNGDFGMGYGFHPDHWGKGYATEMGRALIHAVFSRYDVDRVTACYYTDNPASGHVLTKLGFRPTYCDQSYSKGRGMDVDSQNTELLRADWLLENPLRIETERLLIRAFRNGDAPAFHAFASRPEIARMMQSIPQPFSQEQALDWIERRRYNGTIGFCAGIYTRAGVLIGTVGIGGKPASTMYFVDPTHWGQGYATEAVHAFLAAMFRQFDLPEILAGAMVDNLASQRVLCKLGFRETHRIQHQPSLRLEKDPLIMYRLTRNGLKVNA